MSQFEEYNYVIPSHFICAIEYGDDYLDRDDAEALEAFLNELPEGPEKALLLGLYDTSKTIGRRSKP